MMIKQNGKITFSTIIFFLILFYGGFVAFKMFSTHITKGQIKNEMIDKIGFIRGMDFSEEKAEQIIMDILKAHGVSKPLDSTGNESSSVSSSTGTDNNGENKKVEYPVVKVELDEKEAQIYCHIEYETMVDYLLFKQRKVIVIDEKMRSYN